MGSWRKSVHHAVEQTKTLASPPPRPGSVNAVVGSLRWHGSRPPPAERTGPTAEYFSHPEWLVRAWLAQFGPEATRSLLEWNQQPRGLCALAATDETPPGILKRRSGRLF